jgi:hypothetical protein
MITALVLIGIGLGMLFGSLLSRPLTNLRDIQAEFSNMVH